MLLRYNIESMLPLSSVRMFPLFVTDIMTVFAPRTLSFTFHFFFSETIAVRWTPFRSSFPRHRRLHLAPLPFGTRSFFCVYCWGLSSGLCWSGLLCGSSSKNSQWLLRVACRSARTFECRVGPSSYSRKTLTSQRKMLIEDFFSPKGADGTRQTAWFLSSSFPCLFQEDLVAVGRGRLVCY